MPKIISVHSFRGGTGKSNLTANLAVCMAERGRRVGIVDTDIMSPGIHVLFGLKETKIDLCLNDYLWGRCAIDETAYDVSRVLWDQMEGEPGALFLIPSSLRVGEITRVLREGYDVGLLNDGFTALLDALRLDVLLIDTHPGLNEETLLSVALSDALVLLLRPDQQDYQGTAVAVEVARKLGVPEMVLVVNKALPSLRFEELRGTVERTYGVPVAAVLPVSEEMFQLGSDGIFRLHHADHPYTRGVDGVADRLLPETTP